MNFSIPKPLSDGFNKAVGYATDAAGDLAKDFVSGNSNSIDMPDYARFMRVIDQKDLARTNLFVVRFQDFRSVLTASGMLGKLGTVLDDVTGGIGAKSLLDKAGGMIRSQGMSRIQDIATNQLQKRLPQVTNVVGAIDPTLVRMIPGAGEFIDGVFNSSYDVNKDLALMVKSVNLPGMSLETQKNIHNRTPFTEVRGRTFNNVRVTFYLTPGLEERRMMIDWMNTVHNPRKNTVGFYDEYAKSIDIGVLDRKGRVKSVTNCTGCFPISISDVQYDMENNNQVATFEVEFAVSVVSQTKEEIDFNNLTINNVESLYNRTRASYNALRTFL